MAKSFRSGIQGSFNTRMKLAQGRAVRQSKARDPSFSTSTSDNKRPYRSSMFSDSTMNLYLNKDRDRQSCRSDGPIKTRRPDAKEMKIRKECAEYANSIGRSVSTSTSFHTTSYNIPSEAEHSETRCKEIQEVKTEIEPRSEPCDISRPNPLFNLGVTFCSIIVLMGVFCILNMPVLGLIAGAVALVGGIIKTLQNC